MFLWLDLDSWNVVMQVFLGVTAFAAIGLFVSQRAVIVLQNEAEYEAKKSFEKYKSDAEEKISDANARGEEAKAEAAKAKLEAEQLRQKLASRRLSKEQANSLRQSLEEIKSKRLWVTIQKVDDFEAAVYADDIISVFKEVGITVEVKKDVLVSPRPYGIVISGAEKTLLLSIFTSAGIDAEASSRSEQKFPSITVGLKPLQF